RPRPTHDDAVPNANGLYAEALVRRALMTGHPDHASRADALLETLTAAARAAPLGHTSVLNALDLNLRGAAIVVSDPTGAMAKAALAVPYPNRTVGSTEGLAPTHPARTAAPPREAAIVCAGQRCSLPIINPAELPEVARRMSRG